MHLKQFLENQSYFELAAFGKFLFTLSLKKCNLFRLDFGNQKIIFSGPNNYQQEHWPKVKKLHR